MGHCVTPGGVKIDPFLTMPYNTGLTAAPASPFVWFTRFSRERSSTGSNDFFVVVLVVII
jgi:hypothetical protein